MQAPVKVKAGCLAVQSCAGQRQRGCRTSKCTTIAARHIDYIEATQEADITAVGYFEQLTVVGYIEAIDTSGDGRPAIHLADFETWCPQQARGATWSRLQPPWRCLRSAQLLPCYQGARAASGHVRPGRSGTPSGAPRVCAKVAVATPTADMLSM